MSIKRKLGIETHCLPGVPEIEVLDKLKAAGFEVFFTGGKDEKGALALREKADRLGLVYDFIHAPLRRHQHALDTRP